MKKILIFIFLSILFSCTQKLDNPKYNVGDVVYMKPDSVKAVIISDNVYCGEYEIAYNFTDLTRHYCEEKNIYGKAK